MEHSHLTQPPYRNGFPGAWSSEDFDCKWCNDTKTWWELDGYDNEYQNKGPCRICVKEGREILKKEMGWNSLSHIVNKIRENHNCRQQNSNN